MSIFFSSLLFLLSSKFAYTQTTRTETIQSPKICNFNTETQKFFNPQDLPDIEKMAEYKKYMDAFNAGKIVQKPCPPPQKISKINIPKAEQNKFQNVKFSPEVEADIKKCKDKLMGTPNCVSKFNANRFCSDMQGNDQFVQMAEDCIKKMKAKYPILQDVHKLCLGGGKITGNTQEDVSNCGPTELNGNAIR